MLIEEETAHTLPIKNRSLHHPWPKLAVAYAILCLLTVQSSRQNSAMIAKV